MRPLPFTMVIGSLITSMASNTEGAKRFFVKLCQSASPVVQMLGDGEILRTVNEGDITLIHSPVVAITVSSAAAVLGFHSLSLPDNAYCALAASICQHCQQC